MEEASNKRDPPPTEERHPSMDNRPIQPQLQALSPLSRSRTWNGRSLLYDSYELDTITQELNQALNYPQPSINPKEKHHPCKTPTTIHLQLQPQSPTQRPNSWPGGSMLDYSYEHNAIIQQLDQAPYQPPSQNISNEKCLSTTPTTMHLHVQARTPIWRLSPWNKGSTLYDSHELKAFTQQLNHALRMTHARSQPRASVFHPSSQRLDRLYKVNANAPKRVTCASVFERRSDAKANNKKNHGVMPKLWKKLKQAFLRSKQARSKTSGA